MAVLGQCDYSAMVLIGMNFNLGSNWTIFHEFGHCLHGLLSNRKYTSVGGTSVFWDFVELPSQIMENWVGEKEALSLFAHHHKTGELIPDDLLQKIKDSKNFTEASNSELENKVKSFINKKL